VTHVFFGTPQTAVPTLEKLIGAGYPPALVVTRPDRPSGRGRQTSAPPVKRVALEHGLEVIQPQKVRTRSFAARLAEVDPDFLVVVAYGRILSRRVLGVPRLGPVNLHFSLLPRYRGAAPVQWALARGERTTGVSTILMNERMDEGDVLVERAVEVRPEEHAPALAERLAAVGAEVTLETLEGLRRRTVEPRPQDHDAATYAPILEREDGFARPTMTAAELAGRVRGFDPWPGVWLSRSGTRVRLTRARVLEGQSGPAEPGTLTELRDDGIVMVCGDGTRLLILEIQPTGRRPMSPRDAVNGRQLALGDRLAPIDG
jgi:methionyl-tRNA formyltransferase